MLEYTPHETCCGVRPTFCLLDSDMLSHFAACPGGTPEASLIDWAWSVVGKQGRLFIDIGSHVGSWALPFAAAGMNVVAFEPNSAIFNCLSTAVDLNALSNLRVINCAVSDKHATARLTAPGIDGGMGSIVRDFGSASINELVAVETIDGYRHLQPSVIKVDVEGAEVDVLRGARETIDRCKPTIFFECWEDERGQRIEELFDYVDAELRYEAIKTAWPEMWMAVPR